MFPKSLSMTMIAALFLQEEVTTTFQHEPGSIFFLIVKNWLSKTATITSSISRISRRAHTCFVDSRGYPGDFLEERRRWLGIYAPSVYRKTYSFLCHYKNFILRLDSLLIGDGN